ncbi:MAG: hypothetical protein NTY50_01230 [Methylobacter sp.]|nr:hypothetical protein [Methylobacter sp.]
MSTSSCRWALLSLCLTSTAQAGVLLEKVSYPGFVMTSYAINKSCTISDNGQLTLHYQLDGMSSKRTVPLQLTKASIKTKIAEAALGVINSENFPVDVNTVIYRAYQKQDDSPAKAVLLYEENGGSGEKKVNDSEAAVTLRNFIDLNCGNELLQ